MVVLIPALGFVVWRLRRDKRDEAPPVGHADETYIDKHSGLTIGHPSEHDDNDSDI